MCYRKTCWNCGSNNFIETISKEECPDCGIACYYHGSGANEKYLAAHTAKYERLEKELNEKYDKEYGSGDNYWN